MLLKTSNSGLCNMLVENNGAKGWDDIYNGHYSCAHSTGLMELVKLRNKAQIKHLLESDGGSCTLFGSMKEDSKPRISLEEIEKLRGNLTQSRCPFALRVRCMRLM